MSSDIILFLLRLLSSIALLSILAGLFFVFWRGYRSTATQALLNKRIHGQLIVLAQIQDMYAPTGETHPLRTLTSFGRSATNSIMIKDNFASSEHATISLRDGRWWLEDRNSRNGTLLNGERVTAPLIVTEGDIISIGNTHFKLVVDA